MGNNTEVLPHGFGGSWTESKLEVLAGYLSAYTTALKKVGLTKSYIDGFAGTGYRNPRDSSTCDQDLLFPRLAEEAPQRLLEGSARLALRTKPRFDSYFFVEKDPKRCQELERLKRDYPDRAKDILVVQEDANEAVREICRFDWDYNRAVLFLDPYGMQVEWRTIEAVAATRAIDLWLLFPLGMGANRLLPRSGNIPKSWRRRLDLFFGTNDWFEAFYRVERSPSLFDDVHETLVKATLDVIGRYFIERLKSVFVGVADPPGVLRNSSGTPLYLLCFAINNERGAPIGLRIANHLLKRLR